MTRPPLRGRRPATCFVCARVAGAGAGAGAAGSGAAWALQLRRWCGRSPAPRPTHSVPAAPVPAAGPPPRRPFLPRFPAPSTPRCGGGSGGRAPRRDLWAEREQIGSLGAGGAAAQPPTPRGGSAAVVPGDAGWSRLRPVARAGPEEARCRRCHRHRSSPGPSVQPSLRPRPGVLQPGLPQPARRRGVGGRWRSASGSYGQRRRPLLSGGWWPGTGGAMGARPRPGPALPPTSLATGGAVGPMRGGRQSGGPSRSGAGSPPGPPAGGSPSPGAT